MPPIQRILIECPTQLRTDFGGRDCDWETFAGVNCFKLMISPDQYTQIQTYKNGEPEYIRTLNTPQYAVRAFAPGFDLKISDERDTIFYILQRISTLSTSIDKRTKLDLKIFDFLLPEAEDVEIGRINGTQPYTLRLGAIEPPTALGGRVMADDGRGWIKGGFSLKFREKAMRLR